MQSQDPHACNQPSYINDQLSRSCLLVELLQYSGVIQSIGNVGRHCNTIPIEEILYQNSNHDPKNRDKFPRLLEVGRGRDLKKNPEML
jgi:hypothetical protein